MFCRVSESFESSESTGLHSHLASWLSRRPHKKKKDTGSGNLRANSVLVQGSTELDCIIYRNTKIDINHADK